MKKLLPFISLTLFSLMASCSSGGSDDDSGSGGAVPPSNLAVQVVIKGQDAAHPNGDGSGVVNFTATANHAQKYSYTFPDGSQVTAENGQAQKTFTTPGVTTYTVKVAAIGINASITKDVQLTVLNSFDENFTDLVWSDEFNVDGAPDPSHWGYNTGGNGWGNNELQYYTTDLSNAAVQDGKLKITLKKENYMGMGYTSARLVSENKFDFKYGRIEFRAKLPTGGGTWPALWMLGSNYATAAWPSCGEIDVMEHVGNQQNKIFSTLHYPGHSGANGFGSTLTVPGVSDDFHVYACEWGTTKIKFTVDGTQILSFDNNSTLPFNNKFFIIMNVAMGGNFGGTVDPAFTQSTMEVDYVRVYQ
jgi:beta-glucanase (GH16 family)